MRTIAMILGEAIRESREDLGLTQEQLARERGHSQTWLSYIEKGSREPNLGDLDYLLWRCQLTMPLDEWTVEGVRLRSGRGKETGDE